MSRRALRRHQAPAWWRDAKLGIFVHFTLASVPAFAPQNVSMSDLFARRDPKALAWSPYVEWYENSLRFPESPVARYHAERYGDRPYASFASEFEAGLESWRPEAWAEAFKSAGARYVVLVAKHHDGYCLWPSAIKNPKRPGYHTRRDVVGELAEAVRSAGLRFGLYYSGGLDWTFDDRPLGTFSDLLAAQPGGAYPAYAEAQVRELLTRYRPSVLWNDISWPAPLRALARLLADYYAAVPDGVVNDRFWPRSPSWHLAATRPARQLIDALVARAAWRGQGLVPPRPPLFDVRTPEYTVLAAGAATPWECVRGIDQSFGYNRASSESDRLSRRDLLWSFVDIVARGGNLLLNVGPRGEDAAIPGPQLDRLAWLASFTGGSGAAVFGSRPWVFPAGEGAGLEARFCAADRRLFAVVRGPGRRLVVPAALTPGSRATDPTGARLSLEADAAGVVVRLPATADHDLPRVITLEGIEAAGLPGAGSPPPLPSSGPVSRRAVPGRL